VVLPSRIKEAADAKSINRLFCHVGDGSEGAGRRRRCMESIRDFMTIDDFMSLAESERELAAKVSLKGLLPNILLKAGLLTDSPDASIILHDEKRNRLYFAEAIGENRQTLLDQWGKASAAGIPIIDSKAGAVFATGKAIIENAVAADSTHFKGVDRDTKRTTRSMVCVPLTLEKKPGQDVGIPYERYVIKNLKSASTPGKTKSKEKTARPSRQGGSVFVSYSHKDKAWLQKLQTHLKPYIRGKTITVWDDTRIGAGSRWQDEIRLALGSADVAVLLVSPNFLDSEFIASEELPQILRSAEDKGLRILWVALSASSYDETDIREFQATLDPARPFDTMSEAEQNQAWVALCKKIKEAMRPQTPSAGERRN
jgi:hypothetical protein